MPMVQAALYQLVLDRKVGEYELPRVPRSSPAATARPTAASSTDGRGRRGGGSSPTTGAAGVGGRRREGLQKQLFIEAVKVTVGGDGQQLAGHVEQGAVVAGRVVAQGSAQFRGHERRRAGFGEGMAEAGEQFLGAGARQGEADPDTAFQRQQFLCLQALAEAAVTGQDDGEQEVGVELCLAQQAQFIQHRGRRLLGFVDEQDGAQQSGVGGISCLRLYVICDARGLDAS